MVTALKIQAKSVLSSPGQMPETDIQRMLTCLPITTTAGTSSEHEATRKIKVGGGGGMLLCRGCLWFKNTLFV